MQDRHAERPTGGEVAKKKGGEVERKGYGYVSHLHSPIKFLYFETKGMRQNRVRRVSDWWINKQHWNKDRGEGGRRGGHFKSAHASNFKLPLWAGVCVM